MHQFIEEIFIFQATDWKFGDILGGGVKVGNKCNISKQMNKIQSYGDRNELYYLTKAKLLNQESRS